MTRNIWEYYAALPAPTYDPFKESRRVYIGGRGHGKTARLQKMQAQLEGTQTAMSWLNEYGAFLAELYRDPYEQVRELAERTSVAPKPSTIPDKAPAVGEVRWACKPPTAPVYREGSYGWMMEQVEARITPEMREYNRKLNARYADKVSAIYDILGIDVHGTNGSEVQQETHRR